MTTTILLNSQDMCQVTRQRKTSRFPITNIRPADRLSTAQASPILSDSTGQQSVLQCGDRLCCTTVDHLAAECFDPTLQVVVNRRKAFTAAITDDAQVFHPLGMNANPVRIRDWVSGEDGQFDVITVNESQAARLRNIIRSNDVFQIQWAQGGRTYCVLTGVAINETLDPDVDFYDADGTHL